MSAYTKLFQSIITSTLWRESPETKVVWVTMMAIADKNGIVEASVPGLAAISHVSIEECEAALKLFMSPDKWSRTPDNEGRRIAPVDGGWELLNHEKYRLKMTEDERKEYERVRKQRQRERARENMPKNVPDMSGTSPGQNETQGTFLRNVPHSEEEEEEESIKKAPASPASPQFPFESQRAQAAWAEWQQHCRENRLRTLKPTSLKRKFAEFAEWGEARTIAAIERSIAQGWKSIFEDPNGKPAQQKPASVEEVHDHYVRINR